MQPEIEAKGRTVKDVRHTNRQTDREGEREGERERERETIAYKGHAMVPKVYLHLHSVIKPQWGLRDGRSYRSMVEEEQLLGILNNLAQRARDRVITKRKPVRHGTVTRQAVGD